MIRVCLYFPVNNDHQIAAFNLFIHYVIESTPEEEPQSTDVTGFTYGSEASLYTGYYWSTKDGEEGWMRDNIILLFIDFDLTETDLTGIIENFKQQFLRCYEELGEKQLAVWCITHEISPR